MKLKNDILNLIEKINNFEKDKSKAHKLPSNSYFLDDDLILLTNTENSGARFPYAVDGTTIWAYASGYITINHSSFYLIQPSNEGKEPLIDFFGIEKINDKNVPISLLGVSPNDLEENIKRYTVFSKNIAYYITKSKDFTYVISVFIDQDKNTYFNMFVKNETKELKEITTSHFFNLLMKYDNNDSIETKWFKKVSYENNMYIYDSPEDIDRLTRVYNYGVVKPIYSKSPLETKITTSRSDFAGGRNLSIRNSKSLREKYFNKAPLVTQFNDTAVNADLNTFNLEPNELIYLTYQLSYDHGKDVLDKLIKNPFNLNILNNLYETKLSNNNFNLDNFKIEFNNLKDKSLESDLLNQFLKLVKYQTHFASLSSNSGTNFLGVRDVMQQLEASLIWDPLNARKKIIEVISFTDPKGLPPRQYSVPPKGSNARMDLRPFIDQGVWIIETLYTYLAYTNDYSILDEMCVYYERIEPNSAKATNYKESVMDHLIKIADYLISNIDPKTNCLKTLYGDWNDALDGLGLLKGSSGYGNGVSVMATLQLYESLNKMSEILTKLKQDDKAQNYLKIRKKIEKGILENAIIKKDNVSKILHGWGHNKDYFVGSFNDPDHVSRDSLTSNAFFVISKMINHAPNLKEDIINAIKRLDSKYGLKTFEPYFKEFYGFGRIFNLPKGTAENAATYIHASLFGVMALYFLGESEFANQEMLRSLPITKKEISTSPFVMPNSYIYNEELNLDGESMSDWYTGSANTLIKTIIKGLFGINITLDKLILKPAKIFFSNKATHKFYLGEKEVIVTYLNKNNDKRIININGVNMPLKKDNLSNVLYLEYDKDLLLEKNSIEIID